MQKHAVWLCMYAWLTTTPCNVFLFPWIYTDITLIFVDNTRIFMDTHSLLISTNIPGLSMDYFTFQKAKILKAQKVSWTTKRQQDVLCWYNSYLCWGIIDPNDDYFCLCLICYQFLQFNSFFNHIFSKMCNYCLLPNWPNKNQS